jgi:hypothetical protein
MESTVTELLRDFPRFRRAVFAGETVIIKSSEGNMRLTLDSPAEGSLLGCLKGQLIASDDDLDRPTSTSAMWESCL